MNPKLIKAAAALAWLALLGTAFWAWRRTGMAPQAVARELRLQIELMGVWGPVAYVCGYSLRSLVFFPASVLSAVGGVAFGPLVGLGLTLVGENLSANLSFVVARYFGAGPAGRLEAASPRLAAAACRLAQNGFMAVLTMRLAFMPFDLVGYFCGASRIRQRDFALATALGTLPGLATFVLLGSAVANLAYLPLAAAFGLAGCLLARRFRRRSACPPESGIRATSGSGSRAPGKNEQ